MREWYSGNTSCNQIAQSDPNQAPIMNSKICKLVFVGGTLLSLNSCLGTGPFYLGPLADPSLDAQAKTFSSVAGMSIVYIFRSDKISEVKIPISVDQGAVADVVACSYLRVELQPGSHSFSATNNQVSSLNLITEPGHVYFISSKWHRLGGSGFVNHYFKNNLGLQLQLLPNEDGREEVKKLKLMKVSTLP